MAPDTIHIRSKPALEPLQTSLLRPRQPCHGLDHIPQLLRVRRVEFLRVGISFEDDARASQHHYRIWGIEQGRVEGEVPSSCGPRGPDEAESFQAGGFGGDGAAGCCVGGLEKLLETGEDGHGFVFESSVGVDEGFYDGSGGVVGVAAVEDFAGTHCGWWVWGGKVERWDYDCGFKGCGGDTDLGNGIVCEDSWHVKDGC